MITVRVVEGDLLDQDADALVNAWNRNIIPWWLLLPQGVSGALKRRAGTAPFRELARHGPMPLGTAVATGPGRMTHLRGLIHVAGIDMWWRASPGSVRASTNSALTLAHARGWTRLAMPLVGAGSGGLREAEVEALMRAELEASALTLDVTLVRYRRAK